MLGQWWQVLARYRCVMKCLLVQWYEMTLKDHVLESYRLSNITETIQTLVIFLRLEFAYAIPDRRMMCFWLAGWLAGWLTG